MDFDNAAPKIVSFKPRNVLIEDAVVRYADMIYRIAYHNMGSCADAQDAVQEVSLTLVRDQKAPLDTPAHLKSYLIRVTLNYCKDVHKSAWRRRTEPLDEHTELISPEDRSVLDEVMALKPLYRNVIYLYYYEGYNTREIGEMLNKSENTISSALRRARMKLKDVLTEGGFRYE